MKAIKERTFTFSLRLLLLLTSFLDVPSPDCKGMHLSVEKVHFAGAFIVGITEK